MNEQEVLKIENEIFEQLKDKVKNTYSKETQEIIEKEIRNRNYLSEDWQILNAVDRTKERIKEYLMSQIKPLTFKEEMKNPVSVVIFIVTTLIVLLSGVAYFSGHTSLIFLLIFIGGVSFVIKQIIKERAQKKKYKK